MSATKFEISKGAEGIFVKNSRFKTTLVSFNFYLPISRETAAQNALLPFVLTSCGKNYPDFRKLNFKLSKLYGAQLSASAEKVGDYQVLKMSVSVIGDKYTLDGEVLTSEAVELLKSLVFEPKAENGEFCAEDVEREKRKAIEHIKGEFSEKRIYSKGRLIEEMYKDEPYGVPKCGTAEDVEKIDGKMLYKAWENMLSSAFIRVNVVGDAVPIGLFDSISQRLSEINRIDITDITKTALTNKADKVNRIEEHSAVNQGKLVMGFSAEPYGEESNNANLLVTTDIFGGGPYSKLFSNVREKMSLCYYCSARGVKIKGLVTVESGIEAENAEKAQKAILDQLENLKNGNLTDEEYNSSILGITDSINSYNDSSEALEAWYATRFSDETFVSPEEFAEKIKAVTKDDVIKTANGIKLHTVFLLLPEEK